MGKKLTIEYVKKQIEERRPGSICKFTEYKNNQTKLDLICEKGHNFKISYNCISTGQWCAECNGNKKYTIEEVKQQIEQKYPGAICKSTEYKNAQSKLDLVCKSGHQFKSCFNNIQNDHWCQKCAGNKKYTTKYVKAKIEEKHPGVIFNSVEYKNNNTKLDLICENGHKFKIKYRSFQKGHWCSECSGTKKLTIEYIKNYIGNLRHGAVVSSTEYKNGATKLDLICENGHKFQIRYKDIQQGKWCAKCAELKSEKYIRSIFEKLTGKEFNKARPNWLINPKTNHKLELDGFNEETKIAFECQGDQHYKHYKGFHKTKEAFEYQKYKDKIKEKMCKDNNVKLICVPAIRVNIGGKIYKKKDIEKLIKDFLINECNQKLSQEE